VFVNVADPVTLDVPLNAPVVNSTSPVVEIVRPVAKAVAVPDKVPVKLVASKLVNPVTEETVPPKVIVVDPKIVVLFASFTFVILPSETPAEATRVST
jgi:hypothetical protein